MTNLLGYQLNGWFLAAGAACATVPIIIHLLNRRRYRVVDWAAMDFLRQALQRNRRIMQIRDLLLLALRTLAVLLFGLALSQPLWRERSDSGSNAGDRQPVHAVMIIDNSMSMGYEPSAGDSLLSRAKARGSKFIEDLPSGSRVSVVPLCGASNSYSLDPYRSIADAASAIERITVVDATTNIDAVARVAQDAAALESNLAQRVVFLSDQQRANWDKRLNPEHLKEFPEMQIVDVSGALEPQNSWISDFRMDDDVADLDSPTNFTVHLRHNGATSRKAVQLRLLVDGKEVARPMVDLEPGTGKSEVSFQHTFGDSQTLNLEPGELRYVPVSVSLAADDADRLTADNERFVMAPVVAALPVVFIDEVADSDENRSLNRFGETWQLRRWLAPIVDREAESRQLVRIVHTTIDEIDQAMLAEARLVVIAGVENPAGNVELLREYVQQGGQMLIAAGGEFNPSAWHDSAWQKGQGILPAPLEPDFIGQVPGPDANNIEWFELVYDPGLGLFKLVDEPDAELAALYSEPFFFQAVRIGDLEGAQESLRQTEPQRLEEELASIAELAARKQEFNQKERRQKLSPEERDRRDETEAELRTLRPKWLTWANPEDEELIANLADKPEEIKQRAEETAVQQLPQVLARFDNGEPYLIERKLGQGRIVFATSGIKPEWNTIARTNAMLLFDRLLRGMLNQTVPRRTFVTQENISIPLEVMSSDLEFELQRPAHGDELPQVETLRVGFIGPSTRGLTINHALHQGIYQITAYQPASGGEAQGKRKMAWQSAIAVNVESAAENSESELEPLSKLDFDERVEGVELPITWVGATDSISVDGVTVRGQDLWMWLAFIVLVLLLVEISVLAWPSIQAQAAAESTADQVQPVSTARAT